MLEHEEKIFWKHGWLSLLFGFSSDYHYVLGPAEERCSAHHNVQPRSADAGPAQTLSVGAWSVQPGAGFATKKGKQSRWKTETRRIAARSVQRAGYYISSKRLFVSYLLIFKIRAGKKTDKMRACGQPLSAWLAWGQMSASRWLMWEGYSIDFFGRETLILYFFQTINAF